MAHVGLTFSSEKSLSHLERENNNNAGLAKPCFSDKLCPTGISAGTHSLRVLLTRSTGWPGSQLLQKKISVWPYPPTPNMLVAILCKTRFGQFAGLWEYRLDITIAETT